MPEPPSHDPQFSNLYLQSAGGRAPRVRLGGLRPPSSPAQVSLRLCPHFLPSTCAAPYLQTPSSSCMAPCTGCAESAPHRHLRGNPRRSPCCWGCRAPRPTPRTRSPGCLSSLCLKHTENRAQDPGYGETHSRTPNCGPGHGTQAASPEAAGLTCPSPALLPSPTSPFFLATAEASASRVRRTRRKKPRCCILGGELGSESRPPHPVLFPTGEPRAWAAHPFPHFSGPKSRAVHAAAAAGRLEGPAPRLLVPAHSREASLGGMPRARGAAQTPTPSPAPRWAVAPPGPTRSLARCPRC